MMLNDTKIEIKNCIEDETKLNICYLSWQLIF